MPDRIPAEYDRNPVLLHNYSAGSRIYCETTARYTYPFIMTGEKNEHEQKRVGAI